MTLMKRDELLQKTRQHLVRAGFYGSSICKIRPISFDFIARRDNTLLIVKVFTNIGALREEVASELVSIAQFLGGVPVVVGCKSCASELENDVVYFRYGVPIITFETLDDVLHGIDPFILAAPGGFYTNIDGEILKMMRMERGVSVGQLARVAGVSRRTIRMYEQGERAGIEMAEKMADFLGDAFIKPYALLEEWRRDEERAPREVQDDLLRLIKDMCTVLYPTQRSPFRALSQIVEEKYLVGVGDRRIEEKARIMANLARVTEKESVIFMEKYYKTKIAGVPVIVKREIVRITDPSEINELIEERK
jgi:putative transcriptional regulator